VPVVPVSPNYTWGREVLNRPEKCLIGPNRKKL